MARIKLNILNMKDFLETINACTGRIFMHDPDDGKVDIRKEGQVQNRLWNRYFQNRKSLKLVLEISDPGDYMKIVSWYAGDC